MQKDKSAIERSAKPAATEQGAGRGADEERPAREASKKKAAKPPAPPADDDRYAYRRDEPATAAPPPASAPEATEPRLREPADVDNGRTSPGLSGGTPPGGGGTASGSGNKEFGGHTRGITPPPKPPVAAGGEAAAPPTTAPVPSPITAPPKPTTAPVPRTAEVPAPPPPPAGAVGEEKEDWTVVPVFYGTDRARVPNDKRIDYGSERARKLELGRALITVPKKHEVPQVERPWAITIPYFNVKIYEQAEDPKSHFTLQELKSLSEAELLGLVKQRLAASARFKDHAFVFIHGYNTTFDNALYRTAQVAYDIKFDGAPFLYSWPSGGGIASYTYDGVSAEQAEPFLGEFLKLVTQKSGATSVSVIAHSMGNRLLLRVLQEIQRTKPEGVKISQVILAAPDVDRDSFENIASALKGLPSGGITLYASSNDRALEVSRRFHGGVPRAGDVPNGVPLIVPGVDTIDATSVSMDSLGLHHSGYAENNALLSDIGALIQTGERPPEKRVPILKKLETDKGAFWRYP
ncbi:MAG: alpha/beta hydrolase [Hyphomicrobiaceae bacterium]|nr:alpha/beta hydrolase [Hyphomicrobiaceae bacterium]